MNDKRMTTFRKKKFSRADELALRKTQFGSRQHMLETIHLAYQYILDQDLTSEQPMPYARVPNYKRLDKVSEYELGRRLFKYFKIKE